MKVPEIMRAVQLGEPGDNLIVRNVKVPEPGKGEVLVRMAAAPVNPSDLQRIKGIAGGDFTSFIPGIEGSGTIVSAGSGFLPRLWLGKRVACSSPDPSSGTWAEFMVTKASYCFPIPSEISDEQGAMLLVNPMTALAFFDMVRHEKHKAVVNTAAAGALGGMIAYLGRKYGIPVINIVRSLSQEQKVLADGSKYVLNNTESDFPGKLKLLCDQLGATLALDPIGGNFTQILLDAIPYGGKVVIYGNLSDNVTGPSLRPLVLDNKKIHGFYLVNWMKDNSLLKTVRNLRKVRSLLGHEFQIQVRKTYPLEQAQLAIDTYLNNMTAGKVILVP